MSVGRRGRRARGREVGVGGRRVRVSWVAGRGGRGVVGVSSLVRARRKRGSVVGGGRVVVVVLMWVSILSGGRWSRVLRGRRGVERGSSGRSVGGLAGSPSSLLSASSSREVIDVPELRESRSRADLHSSSSSTTCLSHQPSQNSSRSLRHSFILLLLLHLLVGSFSVCVLVRSCCDYRLVVRGRARGNLDSSSCVAV